MHYIYLTTNTINGKKYIGQRKCPENLNPDTDKYLGSGTLLISALKKYKSKNFTKIILKNCKSQKEADYYENYFFEKYNVLDRKNSYYNRGHAGQCWRSDFHKGFMSETMKNFYKNPENKEKLLKATFNKIKNCKKWIGKTYEDYKDGNYNLTPRQKIVKKHGQKTTKKIYNARDLIRQNKLNKCYFWHYVWGEYSVNQLKKVYIIENNPSELIRMLEIKEEKKRNYHAKRSKHSKELYKKMDHTKRIANNRKALTKIDLVNNTKQCTVCGRVLPLDMYHKGSKPCMKYHQYYIGWCKDCDKIKRKEKDERLRLAYELDPHKLKTCKSCGKDKPSSEFHIVKGYPQGTCKECYDLKQQQRRLNKS